MKNAEPGKAKTFTEAGKRKKAKKIILLLIIVLLYIWGYALKVEKYRIDSDKIESGLKIVFISDLHNCSYGGSDQSRLMNEIKEASPDIVFLGGDLIDQYGGTDNALMLATELAKEFICCYTPGNHEMWRDDLNEFERKLLEKGIYVLEKLDGDSVSFDINGQQVRVYGKACDNYSDVDKCIEGLDENYYNILLEHQPENIDKYINDIGNEQYKTRSKSFDLILSGHAHGGQWRLPVILEQGLYAPDQGIFPDYTNGMYTYDDTVHIISRGLAKPLRMILIPRIFNRPEFTVIEID